MRNKTNKYLYMNTIITNDNKMSLINDVALKGEKYLAEHNDNIDLDDDFVSNLKKENEDKKELAMAEAE